MAAPLGNQNATKAKPWADAIRRALARAEQNEGDPRSLNALADRLLTACQAGELQALKELGDRLDGKPAQAIVGDDEQPLQIIALVRYQGAAEAGS